MTKRCPDCNTVKNAVEFCKNKSHKDGLSTYCKLCRRKRDKESSKTRDKKKKFAYKLMYNFGITVRDYDWLLLKQKGVCAICGKPEIVKQKYGVKRLAVDHSHKTGKVRGLLCQRCNRFLGLIGENIGSLFRAIEYIKTFMPEGE